MSENLSGFKDWKNSFRNIALENNISKETFDTVMANIEYLPNVIKYDRYQPEFYEDTKTYISKRTSSKKVSKGISCPSTIISEAHVLHFFASKS